jgi:hypothetical protein
MVEQARKLAELGATDIEIADFLEIDVATLNRWKASNADFCASIKVGKEAADERVRRSLYHKAVGYTYDAEKIFQFEGAPVRVPYREHVPPSDTAAIFWLKNRDKANWRDRIEHASDPDAPLIPAQADATTLARAMLAIVAKAEQGE